MRTFKLTCSVLGIMSMLFFASAAGAANPYLVKDINATVVVQSSNPTSFVEINGMVYFAATTTEYGTELWKSDGTAPGTVMVKDIYPGAGSSSPINLINVNGTLFFSAADGANGAELWKSDGTAAGTIMLKDIYPGPSESYITSMTSIFGTLYFSANDGTSSYKLWKSDGTAAGTVIVKSGPTELEPSNLTDVNGTLFFSSHDGVGGHKLWKSDGTAAGTVIVKDIYPGTTDSPQNLIHVNGTLFFTAMDATNGRELWKSDGSEAGTVLVKDIYPGASYSNPSALTNVNGTLFFTADDGTNGRELWKSDGTAVGTVMVKDIYPGVSYSPFNLTNVNGTLFFTATDPVHGTELWKSDGTETGTVLVKDIYPGATVSSPYNLTNLNGILFFTAMDPTTGNELWKSDGTEAGTVMVKDIFPGAGVSYSSNPSNFINVNGMLFFRANDGMNGTELWVSHGTATDTYMLKDIRSNVSADTTIANLTSVNGTLYFTANDNINGNELWKSDGTVAGTVVVKDIVPGANSSSPIYLTDVNGMLFFRASDSTNGTELWKSDGTEAGTIMVKDNNPGIGSSNLGNFTNVNGTLFFTTDSSTINNELWKSDGTSAGTVMVKDINPGTGSSSPANLANANGTLFFAASDGTNGIELWKSDGTEAGTVMVKDIYPGLSNSNPANLTNVNGTLFFTAYDGTNGVELWKSDGTTAGTVMVKDIYPGLGNSSPLLQKNINGTLFFRATDGTNGIELWKSDGTIAGTVMVKDIWPGTGSSSPGSFTELNGTLFFRVPDGTNGIELWKSDGTAAGTVMVKDINPGANDSNLSLLTNVNGSLFFRATDGTNGIELWKSDGTATGTVMVKDLYPGDSSSNTFNLKQVNNTLFFTATNGTSGTELYAYSLAISINDNATYAVQQSVPLTLTCPLTNGCAQMTLSNDCVFDTEQWQTFATSVNWPLSAGDGLKKVCVKFKDDSNNESQIFSNQMITLDTTPPDTIISDFPATPTTSPLAGFTFTSPDPTATFQCWLDFDLDGYQPCTSAAAYYLYQGSHTFRVRAVDPAGNIDPSPMIYEWTIVDNLGGTAFGWGGNNRGQLGIGSADYSAHPLAGEVDGPVGFVQISASWLYTAALRNDGTVWVWGVNQGNVFGQTHSDSSVPVQVPGIDNVQAISTGDISILALKKDGTIWTWGNSSPGPHQVLGIDQAVAVAAGKESSMALRQDGTVWVWGTDYFGELGQGTTGITLQYPKIVPGLSGITAIAHGGYHCLAIRGSDGRVFTWGSNAFGKLGDGTTANRSAPTPVDKANGAFVATRIAAGLDSSIAVDDTGKFWSWGLNDFGNLGLGDYGPFHPIPVQGSIPGNSVIDVSAGYTNTMFLTDAGTVWMAGANDMGQIGRGLYDDDYHPLPEKVAYLSGVYSISFGGVGSGWDHAFAVRSTWVATTLDDNNSPNRPAVTSIAVDNNNNAHISYYVENLSGEGSGVGYISNAGGSWQKELLPLSYVPPYGQPKTEIAVDSNGKAHVCASVRTGTDWFIYYLTNVGGSWSNQLVDSGGSNYTDDQKLCSIAVKDNSNVYISYYAEGYVNGCGGLKVAWLSPEGTINAINTVDDGCASARSTGLFPSIAVDATGVAHISYYDQSMRSLKYATGMVSPVFSFQAPVLVETAILNADFGQWSSLKLTNGLPAISYTIKDYVNGNWQYSIRYAKFDGSLWNKQTVDASEKRLGLYGTSLAFVSGAPYISYYDDVNGDLKVAYWSGSRWVRTAVDTDGRVGKYSSIASDNMNGLHVSYWDDTVTPTRASLKYATNVDATRPTGGLLINNGSMFARSASVPLTLTCGDGFGIGCWQVVFSPDGNFNIDQAVPFVATLQYTLPASDGPKTVYASYRDAANNWSIPYSASITLDTLKPTGVLSISSGSLYTGQQNVTLTLSASDTNGITLMQFSNDGVNWSTPETYASTRAWALVPGDGVKTVHVRFQDPAGNWSDPVSDTISLDATAPVSQATPGGGSYGQAQTVTISCDDNGGVNLNGCAATYYSIDGGPPIIPYSETVPVTIAKNATLKYYSVDSLGNREADKSSAYTFVPGYTELTLELTTPAIPYNGSATVFGRLQNLTANNASPVGEKIFVKIKAPDGSETTHEVTITDQLGTYILSGITGFTQKGVYTLTANFEGASLLAPSTSPSSTLLVGASAGYAILIEGKIANDPEGLKAHNKTANRIYQKLKKRGFVDDNIYYFNYDMGQTNVDAIPFKTSIQSVIETWAKARMNGLPAPLYIIMVDHGSNSGDFHINNETIKASDLSTWLGTLEDGLSADAKKEKRFIINGSCYSGMFIQGLSQVPTVDNGGRVIISSAASDEVSYKGPPEQDGSEFISSGEFFLEEFFTQLERGYPIRQAFLDATAATRIYTQKGGGSANSNAPYYDGAVQHPMLDDNGDGSGSNILLDGTGQDGETLRTMVLGAGASYSTNSAQNPVDITAVNGPAALTSDAADTTVTLWATVNDDNQVDSAVWVEIRKPSSVLNPPFGSTIQADLGITRIPLAHSTANNRWETTLDLKELFVTPQVPDPVIDSGTYEIFYFVRDSETLKLSPMKSSIVYKEKQGNQPPNPVVLLSPDNSSEQMRVVSFSWAHQDGSGSPLPPDPDGNPVTYTLKIYEGATLIHQLEGISDPLVSVGFEAGLVHGHTYRWYVQAVDSYGATATSVIRTFIVNDPNGTGSIVNGYVKDSVTNAPISGALVKIYNGSTLVVSGPSMGTLGKFSISTVSGTYTFKVSCPGTTGTCSGYSEKSVASVTLIASADPNWPTLLNPVRLTSTSLPSNPVLTIVIAGGGSGTVYGTSTPAGSNGGITCIKGSSANCSDTYTLNQVVMLTASLDWKSLFSGWSGGYVGSTNPVDIPMSGSKSITATFTANVKAKVGITGYASLQDAYNAIADGATLQMQAYDFLEHMTLNKPVNITMSGGLDSSYLPTGGFTIMQSLTIEQGSVVIYGVEVR